MKRNCRDSILGRSLSAAGHLTGVTSGNYTEGRMGGFGGATSEALTGAAPGHHPQQTSDVDKLPRAAAAM